MGDAPLSHRELDKLLKSLNEVIAEAQRLSAHIREAQKHPPFWPERRRMPRQRERATVLSQQQSR
jgi:hypothetical protein